MSGNGWGEVRKARAAIGRVGEQAVCGVCGWESSVWIGPEGVAVHALANHHDDHHSTPSEVVVDVAVRDG